MIKSRKGQEGFTLIELLVVVLIIGILAAIAIPAFLGQKKGAQDANAKSLLRNAAIAMESYYSENQTFGVPATAPAGPVTNTEMQLIEPNITWQAAGTGSLAKENKVDVTVSGTYDAFALVTKSASGTDFSYVRDKDAKTAKCKALVTTTTAPAACGTGVATW